MKNKCYSFYGSSISKSGKYLNVSLVAGKDDKKEIVYATIKLDGKKAKLTKDKTKSMIILNVYDYSKKENKEDNDEETPF